MSLRTPLARARGLGSAKQGSHHWWLQRLSSIALVPLSLWFVASIVALAGAGYTDVLVWLSNPIVAALMILTLVATFHHAALGMQVVYEDYVSPHWLMLTVDIVTKFLCVALAVVSILAVLKIAVAG